SASGEAGTQGEGNPRGAGALGAPAGYGHDQVGVGGSLLRHSATEEVRRDRATRGRPCTVPGHVSAVGDRRDQSAVGGVPDIGPGRGASEALLLDPPEDDRAWA